MFKLKGNVYWVGIKDWEIKRFHGEEYSTHRGSTCNYYLIKELHQEGVWVPGLE